MADAQQLLISQYLAGGAQPSASGGMLGGADSGIAGRAALALGLGGHIGISPETMMARKAANLQLKQMKKQGKRQDQIFDMLLGTGGSGGGMLGGLFGSLTGSGGAGGNISQPGFQEGPGGSGSGAPQLGQSPGFPQGGYGAGQRAALQEQFRVAQNNLLGSMEARGMGGSSLVGPGLASVARQQSLASGELEDRLFREQLQFRAAERAPLFGLLGQLLGSVGV